MTHRDSNRFLPLADDNLDTVPPDRDRGGRSSRASGRRSASVDGPSEHPSLKDLAEAALTDRAVGGLDAAQSLGGDSTASRGRIRKHDEFAPEGTPTAERTARAERWVRAHNSMSSLGDRSTANDTGTGAVPEPDDGHTITLRQDNTAATPGPRPPSRQTAVLPAAPTGTSDATLPPGRVASAFVTASSLLCPRIDPDSGMTLLWPTPAESVRSAPTHAQAGRATGRPPRPRSQQARTLELPGATHKTSNAAFKVPAVPTPQPAAPKKTVASFDVDEGVWRPFTRTPRPSEVDSLGATSMDISPSASLVAGLRSVKREDDDTDSWLHTSAGRGGHDYSPPLSPTTTALGLRQVRHDTVDQDGHRRGDASQSAAQAGHGTPSRPVRGGALDGRQHDSLTNDEDDMYVDDGPPHPAADSSSDDAGLDSQETDEDHVASDEDRLVAGTIHSAFEQTKIPMRAASRMSQVIDGATAGSLWAGVDPGTLSQWAKLATGNFGVRVHSVDTSVASMNSVQLKLDLQNAIRCTEPSSEAMVALGRAAQGSPPAAPGLFLVHNVSLRTAAAWTSHQLFQVGRYCLIVFERDHKDSTFVGTWAESTMPCTDLETGLCERCKNASRIRSVFKEVEADAKGQGGKTFRRFLASIEVRPLVIKPRGSRGVEVTEYNVYTGPISYDVRRADGQMVSVPLSTERRAKLHNAMLEISVPDAFHGAAVHRSLDLKQYNCAICRSKSHPRGKCPAHEIPTCGRQQRKPQERRTRPRQSATNSRRSPAPQAAQTQPARNAKAGPSSRGRGGRSI